MLKDRMHRTIEVVQQALIQSGSNRGAIEVYAIPRLLHFSYVLTNERHLFLSVYEQFRGPNVRSGILHLDLVKDAVLEEYWEDQNTQILNASRRVELPDPADFAGCAGG